MIFNKIYNENNLKTIKRFDNETIDLVITSPPYNVNLKYNEYKDNDEFKLYIDKLYNVFNMLYNKLKNGGRLAINIGDKNNGALPTHYFLIKLMLEIGYDILSTIIWNKHQVNNRAAWGSFLSPSSPSFPCPYEYIFIFYKLNKKILYKGESDLTKDEFIKWAYGIWDMAPEKKQKKFGHPAMFPLELPLRLIKMLTWKDAIVYDPYGGIGTTAIACKMTGRRYVISEISSIYCKAAKKRLEGN